MDAVTVLPKVGRKTHVATDPVEGARTLCGALIRSGWAGGGAAIDCAACAHIVVKGGYVVRVGDYDLAYRGS